MCTQILYSQLYVLCSDREMHYQEQLYWLLRDDHKIILFDPGNSLTDKVSSQKNNNALQRKRKVKCLIGLLKYFGDGSVHGRSICIFEQKFKISFIVTNKQSTRQGAMC